jgi:hypothetical protein
MARRAGEFQPFIRLLTLRRLDSYTDYERPDEDLNRRILGLAINFR